MTPHIVFTATDVDPVLVVANNFGIVKNLVQHRFYCYVLDYSILAFALLAVFFPLRKYWYIGLLLTLGLFDYGYAALTFHHSHGLYSLVTMALPFCFIEKEKEFPLLWRLARYIPIFLYLMAFYWKVKGGAFLHPMQGVANVKENLPGIIVDGKGIPYAEFIAFFLRHPFMMNALNTLGFCIEGAFAVALFTKKMDVPLMVAAILLHVSIVFFLDAYFTYHLIILLPLLPIEKVRGSLVYRFLTQKY